MDKKYKQYNLTMVILAIAGLLMIGLSFFVDDPHTEKGLEWPGFILFWTAVIMKLLHPKLSRRKRNENVQ